MFPPSQQVGDILSRVALPIDADISGFDAAPTDGMPVGAASGQSLTSLLRDPALIFKLVILSALSLLPVLFKVSFYVCEKRRAFSSICIDRVSSHSPVQTQSPPLLLLRPFNSLPGMVTTQLLFPFFHLPRKPTPLSPPHPPSTRLCLWQAICRGKV